MVQVTDGEPAAARLLTKLCLRLDDGSVIRKNEKGEVECLNAEQAFSAGCLSEAHLLRTQALLCELHAILPDEGPLRSLSTLSKRSSDTAVEALDPASGKRTRPASLDATSPLEASPPSIPGASPVAGGAAPPAPALRSSESFAPRCHAMIDRVIAALGGPKDASALGFTVAVDPKLVPDYYAIVAKPIHLGEIRQKLKRGQYANAVGFYDDMRLLFDNCFLYNATGSAVHALASHAEALFDVEWGTTPWKDQTPPRPPPPPHLLAPPQLAPPKKSGRGGGSKAAPRRRPAPPRPVARTKSVNSYRAGAPLPADKQAALAAALQDEAVLGAKMEGVVGILQRANELPTNEDGEVELDLSVLTPGTLWALYDFVVGEPAGAGARPASSGFQLAEDSEYEPEDDD